MFKVQENGDGSTSIFCNKTGKLICTIKSQQKAMGLGCRPVNVVEPSPKPRSCCYNLDLKSECSSGDEDKDFRSRSLSPVSVESKEDFNDECLTPDDFARCLNLIPKEKLKNESLDELKSTFPLRHLSRTKKVKIHDDLHDMKFPDDLPITSCLGVKLLKLNPQKSFCTDQTILMRIKNYDSFCRFQLNTPSVCGNFPKLRCREKKEYPVHTSLKVLRHDPTHVYTFGRRQRLQKMITLRTGLDARSRRLLQKCNKKLTVSLRRLTAQEIHNWLQRKLKIVRPISGDCIKKQSISVYSDSEATVIDESSISDSSECSYIDVLSCSTSKNSFRKLPLQEHTMSFTGLLTESGKWLSPSKSSSIHHTELDINKSRTCYVKMSNILKQVCKGFDGYYVGGTKIRIPFLSEYLSSLNPKILSSNSISDNNRISSPRYDHAYHRPISEVHVDVLPHSPCLNNTTANIKNIHSLNSKSKKKKSCLPSSEVCVELSHSPCLNNKTSNIKNVHSLNSKSKKNKSNMPSKLDTPNTNSVKIDIPETKEIPVIDLTNSPEKEKSFPKTIFVSSYVFCCYACGYKNVFKKKSELDISIADHMKSFHHVLNPELFLQSCYDANRFIFTFEAFPGYKKNCVG